MRRRSRSLETRLARLELVVAQRSPPLPAEDDKSCEAVLEKLSVHALRTILYAMRSLKGEGSGNVAWCDLVPRLPADVREQVEAAYRTSLPCGLQELPTNGE